MKIPKLPQDLDPTTPPKSTEGQQEAIDVSSSPCLRQEMGGTYFGYMPHDELVDFLNLLLEAERAGARVCARLAVDAPTTELRRKLREVQQDEVYSCGLLIKALQTIDAEISLKVGNFYEKVMALETLVERLTLLNRGQEWVEKKLRRGLPQIEDFRIRDQLQEMLVRHEVNIREMEIQLANFP